jgi:hypothetical protein
MRDRRKNIEEFIKSLRISGDAPNLGIDSSGFNQQLLNARNLSEEALAHQVLKNTGIPIPSEGASLLRKEDFINQILAERYPEFQGDPDFAFSDALEKGNAGEYDPTTGSVRASTKQGNKSIRELLALGLHEGGHKYDDKVLKYSAPKSLLTGVNQSQGQLDFDKALTNFTDSNTDPGAINLYETAAKGHHAKIPKLREGSFGLGALKSMLETGNFKSVASPFGAMAAMLGDIYRPEELPKANPVAQKQIADAYAAMKHDPTNPEVRKAYEALTSEIEQQYDDLVTNKGLKVSKITGDNPYKSSKDLVNDVRVNNRMSYFPTESGYGSAEGGSGSDHPLLKPSKYLDVDGKPMPANDLFRIVHDYYGHVEGDNKFGATGEERAFQQHKKMLSPEAQKALASETRGQNSWVNYGPFGEENRKNPANTTYAEQKAGLLPPQMTESLDKIENPRLHALEKLSKVTSKIAAPLGVLAGVSGSLADVKEGKYNTAGTRMITNMAPMGIGDLSDKLMESAELRDTSPELFDETYRQTLINIGKRRMREGRSPIVETISGRKVDTSAMDADDEVNKRNALLREKFGT